MNFCFHSMGSMINLQEFGCQPQLLLDSDEPNDDFSRLQCWISGTKGVLITSPPHLLVSKVSFHQASMAMKTVHPYVSSSNFIFSSIVPYSYPDLSFGWAKHERDESIFTTYTETCCISHLCFCRPVWAGLGKWCTQLSGHYLYDLEPC
jgi:hypothetical protein